MFCIFVKEKYSYILMRYFYLYYAQVHKIIKHKVECIFTFAIKKLIFNKYFYG